MKLSNKTLHFCFRCISEDLVDGKLNCIFPIEINISIKMDFYENQTVSSL